MRICAWGAFSTRGIRRRPTQISVHVDHYIGNGEQAHLLSLFGGDAEVGAIRAAIYEKHTFTLTFPDGATKHVGFGPDAACYNGSLSLQGAKRTLRHLVAVSASLAVNGAADQTFIMNLEQTTKDLTWATWSVCLACLQTRVGELLSGGVAEGQADTTAG
jgi:hypothetical protein